MRRLPVYLVLDCSGSMSGERIQQVKNGVQMLVSALRQDPQALETAFLSVITFDSSAHEAVPLTDLPSFQAPNITATGTTAMGEALSLVADCARRDVKTASATQKADWRPMVFLMTDGTPTDDFQKGLARFKQEKWGAVVACGVDSADVGLLKQIAGEAVVTLSTTDAKALEAFFKWVTASISTSSKSVQTGKEVEGLNQLPPPPPEIQVVV
ncbi:MAG: vWA domain-containing protein [Roseimicrobium sp.]